MRIQFLCPCVEPGQSGVGDYTLGLAGALGSIGAETHVLAFADPSARETQAEMMAFAGQQVRTARMKPSTSPDKLRSALEAAVTEFQPDWISLQWVPYAFHPKGLAAWGRFPWGSLFGPARMHWMIHETWIGGFRGAPWKLRITGALQRLMMKQLHRRLRVRAAHTSNPTYRRQLARAGIATEILPLFGALPTDHGSQDWSGWASVLTGAKGKPIDLERESPWVFCFFGTIHRGFPADDVFKAILDAGRRENRSIVILSVGHAGEGARDFDEWSVRWGDRITFHRTGSLSDAQTVQVLSHADFGLSTTPLNVIGKSSAAATLSEQGLPVLCGAMGSPVDGWLPGVRESAPRFWHARDYLNEKLYENAPRPPRGSRVATTARQLLEALARLS